MKFIQTKFPERGLQPASTTKPQMHSLRHKRHPLQITATLILATCALLFTLPTHAQVTSGTLGSFNNLPAVFTTTNAITATTNELVLLENTGLALMGRFASPAVTPVASGVWLWFSVDGTNYPAAPIQLTAIGAGPNYMLWQTNWSSAQLAGFAKLRVQITNANAANLTNAGVIWRRWNSPTH